MNAVEIEEAISILAEQPFVPAEFPYAFLEAFGNKETTIKRLRTGNNNRSTIDGGVLQQNNIHIAVCGEGKVAETLNKVKESTSTLKGKVKFILATDGKEFQAEDLNNGETVVCDYSAFHNHFGFFLPLAGISTVKQIRENAFDIKATSRLNKLYIELLRHNPEWATAERRHDMNHFLARLVFCFFAEDTNIFEGDGLFTDTIQKMSAGDASDTHDVIGEIFRAMDIKKDERAEKKVKTWANDFPYVNGQLFSGSTETPRFTKIARSYLLHVGNLDWKKINPDIFGSMIQAVADDEERGALGMHYTSVPNILKVLNPLFLDDLNMQLVDAGENAKKLIKLRTRISHIRVFDPACGSGNFLVIAYKQLREIEHEINKRLKQIDATSEIPLTNYRGIELRDFSCEIARIALIIAEFQCDVLYRGQKLAIAEFLPLNRENWITCGNALRVNWLTICPPTGKNVELMGDDLFSAPLDNSEIDFENEGGETYICGNPPYLGSVLQTVEQKDDLKKIFSKYTNDWKSLDYVAGWFLKAADYSLFTNSSSAFVSTNSICQGEQVPIIWPILLKKNNQIVFAYTSFKWANLASNKAGVTVVIVGMSKQTSKERQLYSINSDGETEIRNVENINPYLVPAPNTIVQSTSSSISSLSKIMRGNMPNDGGFLLLSKQDADELIAYDTSSKIFIKKFIGAREFINSLNRYCLWIKDEDLELAEEIIPIAKRLKAVRETRLKGGKQARDHSESPHRFVFAPHTDGMAITIPAITSENREYLPVGIVNEDTVVGAKCYVGYNAPLWNLALVASKLHLVWIGTVCVRMRTDYSYSNTLGWNTFPVPMLTEKNKNDLTESAQEILIARERHFPSTIADLYNPGTMPQDLRRAHERNDEILERIYVGRRFKNDTERLEKLFDLYNQMTVKIKTA